MDLTPKLTILIGIHSARGGGADPTSLTPLMCCLDVAPLSQQSENSRSSSQGLTRRESNTKRPTRIGELAAVGDTEGYIHLVKTPCVKEG